MWTLSQKSMPGWVCLPGMQRFFWERPEDKGGGTMRDGTNRGRTCRLIVLCVDRRVMCHLGSHLLYTIVAHSWTYISHAHTNTHLTCKRPLNDSCWSSQSPFSFTRLMNFSSSPLFYLFCRLLHLALMEGTGGRAG